MSVCSITELYELFEEFPELEQCYHGKLDDEDFKAWLDQPGGPDFEDYDEED